MGLNPNALPDKLRRYIAPESKKALGNAGMTYEECLHNACIKTEKALHHECEGYLRMKGVQFIIHSRMDTATTNNVGTPDFVFALRGMACAIELKVGKNGLSQAQCDALVAMRKDGWLTAVCRSTEEFVTTIKGWLGETNEQPHHD